jgi:SAM-dependent methyltransferase
VCSSDLLRFEALAALDPTLVGVVDTTAELEAELIRTMTELGEGTRIIDVGCGAGRHAIALHERGHQVTGVDLSPRILRIARDNWEERHPGVDGPTWLPGDMRRLAGRGPYDGAILMDHAFGLFDDDADHLRVLSSIADNLVPGGHLVIQVFNPYWWCSRPMTRHLAPGTLLADGDVVRSYRMDLARGRLEDRIVVLRAAGREELPVQSLRVWTPVELVSLCRAAGFRRVAVHGSDGWATPEEPQPVTADSVWLWVVATLP